MGGRRPVGPAGLPVRPRSKPLDGTRHDWTRTTAQLTHYRAMGIHTDGGDTRRSVDDDCGRMYRAPGLRRPTVLTQRHVGTGDRVLHAFGRACQDGRIPSSTWNIAEINEITTGAVMRQALDSIEDQDWQHSRDSTGQKRVTASRDRLADSAEYEIHALEV